MRLNYLQLTEFRSYHHLDLPIPEAGLVLVGRNATGKSTVLEAIRMLSTLRSPRSLHDRDVINWTSGQDLEAAPFARVVGRATENSETINVELGMQRALEGAGPLRKVIRVNHQPRRMQDSIGVIQTVLFTPEDLDLVGGAPSGRRRFIDLLMSQIDRGYVGHLARYLRVLEQRNSLLRGYARQGGPRAGLIEQLGFWDEQLAEHGAYVTGVRRYQIVRLAEAFSQRTPVFTQSARLSLAFLPSLGADFLAGARTGDDLAHVLAVARREFDSQLRMRRDEEIRRGMTVVGPHRDELELHIEGRSLADFGSRGQQRLAVIALKLAEADVIAEGSAMPILLLDDLLSELDIEHRRTLLGELRAGGAQIILTTADDSQVQGSAVETLPRAHIVNGEVVVGGDSETGERA